MDKIEREMQTSDVVSIMPCQRSSWIMDSRIYGGREGGTQIPLSSLATIDHLVQDPG